MAGCDRRARRLGQKARQFEALRLAARSVGTGWPSFTYSRPTSTIGCSAQHLAVAGNSARPRHGEVQHVGHAERPPPR